MRGTAKTVQMNQAVVRRANVVQVPSSAKTTIAHHRRPSATEQTIVEMAQTNRTVICLALNLNSSVVRTAVASLTVGNAMEIQTVKMVQMKMRRFVTRGLVIQKRNFRAKMEGVYQNCGCATSIMIVGMILMNRLTCVDRGTALQVGRDAQDGPTTDAYLNGCSATVKTTAAITLTN